MQFKLLNRWKKGYKKGYRPGLILTSLILQLTKLLEQQSDMRAIPNSRFTTFELSNHNPFVEEPVKFIEFDKSTL